MRDTLYSFPTVLARFRAAPLAEERERYLQLCADRGHNRKGLKKISWLLLVIVTHVPLDPEMIDLPMIERAAKRHKRCFKRTACGRRCASSQQIFIGTAKRFFQFMGRLAPPALQGVPFERCVEE